jgi:hypothetical protein
MVCLLQNVLCIGTITLMRHSNPWQIHFDTSDVIHARASIMRFLGGQCFVLSPGMLCPSNAPTSKSHSCGVRSEDLGGHSVGPRQPIE